MFNTNESYKNFKYLVSEQTKKFDGNNEDIYEAIISTEFEWGDADSGHITIGQKLPIFDDNDKKVGHLVLVDYFGDFQQSVFNNIIALTFNHKFIFKDNLDDFYCITYHRNEAAAQFPVSVAPYPYYDGMKRMKKFKGKIDVLREDVDFDNEKFKYVVKKN